MSHSTNRKSKHKSKQKSNSRNNKHHLGHCRGPIGPPGPMGPIGLIGPICLFVPSVINIQNKITEPLEIREIDDEAVVVTITVDIPISWKTYDLVISGELFADETDVHTGVIMTIRKGHSIRGELIGTQVLGYNGTTRQNGIGFSGYHKEIINNESEIGKIKFCLTVKTLDALRNCICDTIVINRQIHLQAFRQS